ncbi:MAG: patatin-like phospholipase family protein [Gemmatimonadaceae bacterium]|nr:patatin-like phospholipase family protein [Gemmatimonadaceae bacterium]
MALVIPRASVVAALLLAAAPLAASAQDSCPAGKTALVLPGGGAHGMAHVGVIRALDSLGIVPDLVVGTSMGSIVGALYASGYSGEEIEALTRRFNVGSLVGRYVPPFPRTIAPSPPLLVWEDASTGLALTTGAADEGRINTLMAALFLRGNVLARGDFDRLPIPYRAVAADLATGGKVVIGSGDLAQAVRASFAIPLVFDPVARDGRVLVDGGIAENIPVATARALGATRVILSSLGVRDSTPPRVGSTTTAVAGQLVSFLFAANRPTLAPGDVEVVSDLKGIGQLDFTEASVREAVSRGQQAAAGLTDLRCLPRGTRRRVPVPPVASTLVTPETSPAVRALVAHALTSYDDQGVDSGAAPLGVLARRLPFDTIQSRVAALGESEVVRSVWLSPAPRGDSVIFAPKVTFAPRRVFGFGAVYDSDFGGKAWLSMLDRQLFGRRLEGRFISTLGEYRQDLTLAVRNSFSERGYRVSPLTSLTIGQERIRLILPAENIEAPVIFWPDIVEVVGRVGVDFPLGPSWSLNGALLGRGYRQTVRSPIANILPAELREAAWGVGVQLRRAVGEGGTRLDLNGEITNRYSDARLVVRSTRTFGRVSVSPMLRASAVTRGSPAQLLPTLGGRDGFAGMHIGSGLGLTEAMGQLDTGLPLFGPLNLQITVMAGQTWDENGGRTYNEPVVFGVRSGVGLDSPVGPIRIQYGENTLGQHMWYIRFGRWF